MNISMKNVRKVSDKVTEVAKVAVENFGIDKEFTEELCKACTPMVLGSTAVLTIIGIGVCGPVAGIRMGLAFGARLGFQMAGISLISGAVFGTADNTIKAMKNEPAKEPAEASSQTQQEPVLN